jgi:hypothetical protein
MIAPQELVDRYEKVKSKGDGKILKKILKYKSHSNVSLVISGKQDTTIEKIEAFKKFIEARERRVSNLTTTTEA